MEDRSREAINRALRTIDRRLEHDRFAQHYMSMAERARSLIYVRAAGNEPYTFDEVA